MKYSAPNKTAVCGDPLASGSQSYLEEGARLLELAQEALFVKQKPREKRVCSISYFRTRVWKNGDLTATSDNRLTCLRKQLRSPPRRRLARRDIHEGVARECQLTRQGRLAARNGRSEQVEELRHAQKRLVSLGKALGKGFDTCSGRPTREPMHRELNLGGAEA